MLLIHKGITIQLLVFFICSFMLVKEINLVRLHWKMILGSLFMESENIDTRVNMESQQSHE